MFSEIIFKEWNLEVVEDGFWACECGEDKPGTFCLKVEATDGGAAGKTETVSLSLLREVKDLGGRGLRHPPWLHSCGRKECG